MDRTERFNEQQMDRHVFFFTQAIVGFDLEKWNQPTNFSKLGTMAYQNIPK